MTVQERQLLYEKYARLRDKQNLTDYRVCKETGIRSVTLTKWKQGAYVPKPDKLKKICDLIGVDITYFI